MIAMYNGTKLSRPFSRCPIVYTGRRILLSLGDSRVYNDGLTFVSSGRTFEMIWVGIERETRSTVLDPYRGAARSVSPRS